MKKTGNLGAQVDQSELRVNSLFMIAVLIAAFVINRWELVAFQSCALLITASHVAFGPYIALYRHLLRPAGIIKSDNRTDNLAPHRFAALFGTIVASAATYLLASGRSVAGWGLVWLLISLALMNLAGWCAGCFTYYMMNRLGLRGLFKYAPVTSAFPGARPPKSE